MLSPLDTFREHVEAVVIGGSQGAIEALGQILPAVKHGTRLPVIVVVHLPAQRQSLLTELFARRCQVPVREPVDKEPVAGGTIWFAGPDYHLLVEKERCFAMSVDDPVKFSRPSIDVLFETAAYAYGASLACIVVTGASDDGADGAEAVRHAGGFVIVQDPDEAEARRMPSAAMEKAKPQMVLTIAEIARTLSILTGGLP
jgi:two-component system chemotaxis response regulator CheB